jgi:hypothetical protein
MDVVVVLEGLYRIQGLSSTYGSQWIHSDNGLGANSSSKEITLDFES